MAGCRKPTTCRQCNSHGVLIAITVMQTFALGVFMASFVPIYFSLLGLLWEFLEDLEGFLNLGLTL